MLTGISEELQTPKELDDVEHSEEAGVDEVEEVVVGVGNVGETQVLEKEEDSQTP